MNYKGKLYGKINGQYFDTGKTAEDYDLLLDKYDIQHNDYNEKAAAKQSKIDDLFEELEAAYERLNSSSGDDTSIEASDTIESVEGELKALGLTDKDILDEIQS